MKKKGWQPFHRCNPQSARCLWSVYVTGNLQNLNPGRLRSIEFAPSATGAGVLVGTDRGVFATSAASPETWQEVGSNLPNAPVFDFVYGPRDDLLAVGLLGRSAWSVTGLAGGNLPPVARCRDAFVDANSSCIGTVTSANIDAGTTDPIPVTCSAGGGAVVHVVL
jgi:hypothetical protein